MSLSSLKLHPTAQLKSFWSSKIAYCRISSFEFEWNFKGWNEDLLYCTWLSWLHWSLRQNKFHSVKVRLDLYGWEIDTIDIRVPGLQSYPKLLEVILPPVKIILHLVGLSKKWSSSSMCYSRAAVQPYFTSTCCLSEPLCLCICAGPMCSTGCGLALHNVYTVYTMR